MFQWKLAGLFHDVGYPAQVAADVAGSFADKLNAIKRTIGVPAPDLNFTHRLTGIEELRSGDSSLDLLQCQLDAWKLEIDANREYLDMIASGRVCHGMVSALAVLHVVDLLYQRHNPNREFH